MGTSLYLIPNFSVVDNIWHDPKKEVPPPECRKRLILIVKVENENINQHKYSYYVQVFNYAPLPPSITESWKNVHKWCYEDDLVVQLEQFK